MESKELRIGNYVRLMCNHSDYNEFQIELADLNLIANNSNRNEYYPIPLTEEWMLNLGFESVGVNFQKKGISIWHSNYQKCYQLRYYFVGDYGNERKINLEYVHQIQNVYFALTGEELEIKSPS